MIDLDHNIWQQLEGANNQLFDASVPLKKILKTNDTKEINQLFQELWNGLHHEGSVGIGSYLALPQIVKVAKEKNIFNWLFLILVSTIEQQRHLGDNPELPSSLVKHYNQGLDELKEYVLLKLNEEHNKLTHITALATIATCNGQPKLGKAIQALNDSYVLDEFLLT